MTIKIRRVSKAHRNKTRSTVKVSEITPEGFWLETYEAKYYISRKNFPWFRDATDEEILDIYIVLDVDDYHGHVLVWDSLMCDLNTNSMNDLSWIKTKNILVRGKWRPDLQDWPRIR